MGGSARQVYWKQFAWSANEDCSLNEGTAFGLRRKGIYLVTGRTLVIEGISELDELSIVQKHVK